MKQICKSMILAAIACAAFALAGCSISPGSKSSYGGAVGAIDVPTQTQSM